MNKCIKFFCFALLFVCLTFSCIFNSVSVKCRVYGNAEKADVFINTDSTEDIAFINKSLPWSYTFYASYGELVHITASGINASGPITLVVDVGGEEFKRLESSGSYGNVSTSFVVPMLSASN